MASKDDYIASRTRSKYQGESEDVDTLLHRLIEPIHLDSHAKRDLIKESEDVNVEPDDSVSVVGRSRKSMSIASSLESSSIFKAKGREIELASQAAFILKRNKLEAERQQRKKQLEDEEAKEQVEAAIRKMEEDMRLLKEKAAREQRKRQMKDEEEETKRILEEMKIQTELEVAKAMSQVLQGSPTKCPELFERSSATKSRFSTTPQMSSRRLVKYPEMHETSSEVQARCSVMSSEATTKHRGMHVKHADIGLHGNFAEMQAKSQEGQVRDENMHGRSPYSNAAHVELYETAPQMRTTSPELHGTSPELLESSPKTHATYPDMHDKYPAVNTKHMHDKYSPVNTNQQDMHDKPLEVTAMYLDMYERYPQVEAKQQDMPVKYPEVANKQQDMHDMYPRHDMYTQVDAKYQGMHDKNPCVNAMNLDTYGKAPEMHGRYIPLHRNKSPSQMDASGLHGGYAQMHGPYQQLQTLPPQRYAQHVGAPQKNIPIQGQHVSQMSDNLNHAPSMQHGQPQAPSIAPLHTGNQDHLVTTILEKLVEHQREARLPQPQLETFDGSVMQYILFIRNFKYAVERNTNDPTRRLEMLIRFTKGEAYELIKDCSMIVPPAVGYATALNLLHRDYGQTATIETAYKERARSWPKIASGDKVALRKFSVFLVSLINTKQGNMDMTSLDSYEFLKVLAAKLPTPLQQKWIVQVGRCREYEYRSPNLKDFENFVGQLSRNENDPRIAGLGYQRRVENEKRQGQNSSASKRNVFATSVQQTTKSNNAGNENSAGKSKTGSASNDGRTRKAPCLYCGSGTNHGILDCRKFTALQLEAKSEFCKTKGLCFGCLREGHTKKRCRNPEKCTKCSRRHPTVLHNPNWESKTKPPEGDKDPPKVTTSFVNTKDQKDQNPLMAIVPVLVKAKKSDQCISTYAFMDNGCGAVFQTYQLQREMKTKTRKTKLLLKTMNLEEMFDTHVVQDELQVGSISGTGFIDLPTVYLKDSIPVATEDIPTQADIDKWEHLKHIRLPELTGNCIPRVTMMIGSNVPAATIPLEVVSSKLGDPYAVRTPLGWLVYGLPGKLKGQSEVNVNFCRVDQSTVHTSIQHLEEEFRRYVNFEFSERENDDVHLSVEDKAFVDMMEESIVLNNGHYQVALPFRNRNTCVPNNHIQAEMYSARLKRKLSKNEKLHEQYTDFMSMLKTKGYCEQVPQAEVDRDDGRVWYLPHHGIYHPQKPDKLRVVFNCPATYKGTSLNQQLLQGPDLTNKLCGVLLRWRQEPIAVLADIEAMFCQVHVKKEDCDMLRYLWWPNGLLTGPLVEYRMLVHVFGAVSSPTCANYVLQKIATENVDKPEVAETIKENFYVDDMLKSYASVHEAIETSRQVKEALQQGGFNLTKWVSNSREVINSIPEGDRAQDNKNLNLDKDETRKERALGVQWNVETDELGFSFQQTQKTPTRRNILSTMCSVYDPLGMVAPYILKAKILLQSLCLQKIPWDEEIPQDHIRVWDAWNEDLTKLKEVKVSRCFKPPSFAEPQKVQLHHFADASEAGYGTVSYLRYVQEREIHCAFVVAKARVSPLKKMSIPRLELNAATVAVRINTMIQREVKIPIQDTYYWTDSQTVLRYINNESSRFHTYVAHRVEVIRDRSQPTQWHYVPSEINPADMCSRGSKVEKLITDNTWFHGPKFLWEEESSWPTCAVNPESIPSTEDPEVRKTTTTKPAQRTTQKVDIGVVKVTTEQDHVTTLITYYSTWTRLKRAVAWWLRLKRILLQRHRGKAPQQESKFLQVEELQQAEEAFVMFVQREAFPEEVSVLRRVERLGNASKPQEEKKNGDSSDQYRGENCKGVSKSSSLYHLNPEMRKGLLRVGGRLHNASIDDEAKHQIILPRAHHVVDLILKDTHHRCNHQGRNHILAELRQKYWIIKAGVAVKNLVKNV